ncbi:MAG: hypothetical protein Q9190_003120 [Brigantiaea leucoxantha]
MAPMAVDDGRSLKRSLSAAEFAFPPAKKLNRGRSRHHKLTWDFGGLSQPFAPVQDEQIVQSMLTRSICLALDAVGFNASEPLALESFRAQVEECMSRVSSYNFNFVVLTPPDMRHFLTDVRQSMLSSRRSQPLPQDFLQALHTHQLSLRALLPHLDPPITSEQSRVALSVAPEVEEVEKPEQFDFLGHDLNDAPNEHLNRQVPHHLPPFPSKHTYKETPEFAHREEDTRKLRERATEEGRLGEEALRKLVSASSKQNSSSARSTGKGRDFRAKRHDMWLETMQAIDSESRGKDDFGTSMDIDAHGEGSVFNDARPLPGRLSSTVNADRRNWRKSPSGRELHDIGEAGEAK